MKASICLDKSPKVVRAGAALWKVSRLQYEQVIALHVNTHNHKSTFNTVNESFRFQRFNLQLLGLRMVSSRLSGPD